MTATMQLPLDLGGLTGDHQRVLADRTCRYCGCDCGSRKRRRAHRCAERDLAERISALHWPTEPIEARLQRRLGTYDQHNNPDGYCLAAVERVLGLSEDVWKRAADDGLTDVEADRVAVMLGLTPNQLWPDWDTRVEPTTDDLDWLDAWTRAGR